MRIRYLDAVKAFAIVMVVAVHVAYGAAAPAFAAAREAGVERAAAVAAYRVGAELAAAGLFFLASGAALLGRPRGPLERGARGRWYRRRYGKLVPPLLIWSVFFLAFRWATGWGWPPSTREWLLLPPGVFYHLWFLYMLFGLYACTPPLLAIRARWPARAQWLAAAALLAAGAGYEIAREWTVAGGPDGAARMASGLAVTVNWGTRFVGSMGLYWTGALLAERPRPGRRAAALLASAALLVVGLAVALALAWTRAWAASGAPAPVDFPAVFRSSVGPFGVVAAPLLFALIRALAGPDGGAPEHAAAPAGWVERLGRASFGIYLLHVVAVWAWFDHGGGGAAFAAGRTVWAVPAATAGCTLAAWAAVAALRRIPGVARWLLP